jgi:PAS domain S-box-containing protein
LHLHNPAPIDPVDLDPRARIAAAVAAPCLVVDPATDMAAAANPAAARLFRLAELVGRRFSALHPDCVAELIVFAEEVANPAAAWTRALIGRRSDGAALALEYEAALDGTGADARLVFIASDLAERARRDVEVDADGMIRGGLLEWRRMERFFRETKRLNDLILTSAGDGVYGVDANGDTTFVNPAAERMLGWSASDLIGRNMHALIHHKRADGRSYPAEECPIYNAFRHARVNLVADELFWRKDGRPLRVEYTSTPMVEGGEVLGAVILFRDITERKEQESRLREAMSEIDRLRARLEMENAYLQEEIRAGRNHHEIIGRSQDIAETVRQIELVAPTGANVLIIGDSGTGKEPVAQAIHQDSPRHERPLIWVNCAAIPRELFESEFFGHVRGAFTGAIRDRVGRFELADGGTLFLDEVGEIPLELQGKLLRVLQHRRYERSGEETTRQTDVRIIAAANRDLVAEVAAGRFREDLYFRLNVFPIALRPLRDRPEDVAPLAQHFLTLSCRRLNIPAATMSRANVAALQDYDWPGNARELENVIERAAILSRRGRPSFDLPSRRGAAPRRLVAEPADADADAEIETHSDQRARERRNIAAAMEAAGGRVSGLGGAAELLGMKPTALYSRLRRMEERG